MEATYDPKAVEAHWYDRWEESGVFRPEHNPEGDPFCVVIPPPNVTGSLHMGHALNHTIHDAVIRRRRMQGYAALWLPGTDHAGIATQNVVEREMAQEGLTRHDIGRDAFVEQVWEWKRRFGNRISLQMRALGDSVDWSRERFTMDDGLSHAVREVFVRLYEEELIYRGDRIINWCPRCGTALAEIEVEYDDESEPMARPRVVRDIRREWHLRPASRWHAHPDVECQQRHQPDRDGATRRQQQQDLHGQLRRCRSG